MKIVNRTKAEQIFNGITVGPGETFQDSDDEAPKKKRRRTRKEKAK